MRILTDECFVKKLLCNKNSFLINAALNGNFASEYLEILIFILMDFRNNNNNNKNYGCLLDAITFID